MNRKLFNGKKILVTGDRGFKGSWLVSWLLKLGSDVYGISLKEEHHIHYNLLNLKYKSYEINVCDLYKVENLLKRIKPDFIFHLAAQPLVNRSYKHPIETWSTNVMGTINVLNVSRKIKNLMGILVITSDKCYENTEKDIFYKENDYLGGHDPYSSSKAAVEILVNSLRKSYFKDLQIQIATARAGNVIGGGDFSSDRLIPDIYRAILNKSQLKIRYPNAIRPWQHVLDCIYGYLLLAEKLMTNKSYYARSWNFGPKQKASKSVNDIVENFKLYFPNLEYKTYDKNVNHEAQTLQLDSSLARIDLEWKTKLNFSETIEYTALWYDKFINQKVIDTFLQIEQFEQKF